jgi:hypothetical protein
LAARLTRHLQFSDRHRSRLELDVYKAPRERAAYLLKVAADVEHSIMVQYLFAAWSLGGPHLRHPKQIALAREWQDTILAIAREEMGHLATVENLLTLIGAPPSLARQDYPARSDLYPFTFALQRLTKESLAKYVLAEKPSEAVVKKLGLAKEIEEIRKSIRRQTVRDAVHRVGMLYDEIIGLFTLPSSSPVPGSPPKPYVPSADIQAGSLKFQVRPGEWKLRYDDLLILSPSNRDEAIDALRKISDQGEGTGLSDFNQSHFGRFLQIYRAFPGKRSWDPSRKVANNPTTDMDDRSASRIRNRDALKWAHLFNLRYRMLLMFLTHSFAVEAPAGHRENTPRALLITWTFGEMYNLRSIAEILMSLPLDQSRVHFAGPPFEMPVSLALAAREPDRWRLHRDLMLASQHCVDELLGSRAGRGHQRYLTGLRSVNAKALEQAIVLVGA